MGDELFVGTPRETSRNVTRFKQNLNKVADNLVRALENPDNMAVAVRSVSVKEGIIRGDLSLKHCARDAGLGSIGDCTLLISPRFGNRVLLSLRS